MNINNNYNYNINNNGNPNPPDGSVILSSQVIRTYNGLLLIDNDGIVQQVDASPAPNLDRWNIVDVGGLAEVRNVGTGRFLALEELSTANGVRIATSSGVNQTTFWIIEYLQPPPILPPPPPLQGFVFTNYYSRKLMEVPDNTSLPGVDMIQYDFRGFFGGLERQLFNIS